MTISEPPIQRQISKKLWSKSGKLAAVGQYMSDLGLLFASVRCLFVVVCGDYDHSAYMGVVICALLVLFSYRQPGDCPPRSPRWPICSLALGGLQGVQQKEQEEGVVDHLARFPVLAHWGRPRLAASKSASLERNEK